MFRTVVINFGERIRVKDNWLVVEREEGEQRLPIEDLYSVVIDNQQASITVPAIHRLTEAGAHLLICDEKHIPVSVILPQNNHYRPLNTLRHQMNLTEEEKDLLWQRIIRAKIENQAKVMKLCSCNREYTARVAELATEVLPGDPGNREGIAAKMFFRGMYGAEFVRMEDDAINAALNYGYAILRSSVAKTLAAYGYNCVLGIHHINESNPYNLADDVMEPLRPIIDMWVDDHREELVDELTRQQRNQLAAIVNTLVLADGKRMQLRNAIDRYVRSLTTCIQRGGADRLIIPSPIRTSPEDEADE